MNLILRDIDSHIVDKIDNLAKQKKISRNEFLKQKVDEFAFEKEANELEYNYQKLQKEIIENMYKSSFFENVDLLNSEKEGTKYRHW